MMATVDTNLGWKRASTRTARAGCCSGLRGGPALTPTTYSALLDTLLGQPQSVTLDATKLPAERIAYPQLLGTLLQLLPTASHDIRIRALDDMKRRLGDGYLPSDARAEELRLREEAEQRMDAMRQRLNYQGRFELYAFEDDELRRCDAFRRWRLACGAVLAMVRLQMPLRRRVKNKANWRKAARVAVHMRVGAWRA